MTGEFRRLAGSSLVRSVVAGLAGFVGYGGWAFYVNSPHGVSVGARSGLVQGSYSMVLTFSTTWIMEFLHDRLSRTGHEVPLTIVIVAVLLFMTAYTINYIAGTPEILATITPGFIIGMVYTTVYVVSLNRLKS